MVTNTPRVRWSRKTAQAADVYASRRTRPERGSLGFSGEVHQPAHPVSPIT